MILNYSKSLSPTSATMFHGHVALGPKRISSETVMSVARAIVGVVGSLIPGAVDHRRHRWIIGASAVSPVVNRLRDHRP